MRVSWMRGSFLGRKIAPALFFLPLFLGGCESHWDYSSFQAAIHGPGGPEVSYLSAWKEDASPRKYVVFWHSGVNRPAVETYTGKCFYKCREIRFPKGYNAALIHKDDRITFVRVPEKAFCRKWKNISSPSIEGEEGLTGIGPLTRKIEKSPKDVVNLDKAQEDPAFRKAWREFLEEQAR